VWGGRREGGKEARGELGFRGEAALQLITDGGELYGGHLSGGGASGGEQGLRGRCLYFGLYGGGRRPRAPAGPSEVGVGRVEHGQVRTGFRAFGRVVRNEIRTGRLRAEVRKRPRNLLSILFVLLAFSKTAGI
jgi:hypothetical protein